MRYLNYEALGIKSRVDLVTFLIGIPAFFYLMYVNFIAQQEPLITRSSIVGLALVVLFLRYPSAARNQTLKWVIDLGHIALTIFCFGYVAWDGADIVFYRIGGATTLLDRAVYLPMVYLVLEGTRRATGWAFVSVAAVLLAYGHFGHLLPGTLNHASLPFGMLVEIVVLNVDGMFGATSHAHITMIWFFLMLGVALTVTGAGSGFIDLAFSAFGKRRGGGGQAAVVSSLLYGMVSGSGVASVASMGNFTIPLMKSTGFPAHIAGGIEAATAMGAQVTPPVLGGTAFILSAITGIAYITLVKVTVPLALLYFLCMSVYIYSIAGKLGLHGLPAEQVPPFTARIFKRAFIPLTAIVIMVGILIMGYTPRVAGSAAILWILLIAVTQKKLGMTMNPAVLLKAISEGFNTGVSLMAILATAGVCVGLVNTTGLGIKFSSFIVALGQGNLLLAIVLVMIAALILGMGLPTPAAYTILAILCGPALVKLGMSVLAAHMLIFYYAVFAGLTPPVGIAFMAAAAIANAKQLPTGFAAIKTAAMGLIIPIVWAYKPELIFITDSVILQIWTTLAVALAIPGLVFGFVGYGIRREISIPYRVIFAAFALLIMFTTFIYQVICIFALYSLVYINYRAGLPKKVLNP